MMKCYLGSTVLRALPALEREAASLLWTQAPLEAIGSTRSMLGRCYHLCFHISGSSLTINALMLWVGYQKIIKGIRWVQRKTTIQSVLSYLLLDNFQFFSFFEGQVIFMNAIIGIQSYHNDSMLLCFYKGRKPKARLHYLAGWHGHSTQQ